MAKTCYRNCWWLIQAVAGEFGTGSFRNGTGYTMRELNDLRPMANRLTWKPFHGYDEDRNEEDEEYRRDKDKFQKNFHNWRAIIYNEFGLVIMMESTSGPDHHGNGGYYYYLANPDLLDKGGESLRDHIKFLAESETKRDYWVSVEEMTKLYKSGSSTMGFISTGGSASRGYLSNSNTTPRIIFGEENLPLVQFAMKFGEVLTIKYSKVRDGVDIDAPYSFEPYQVKEIEGRWYAIGNLYPMGHKESAELAVYDLTRLEIVYDEENPDVLYEPIKGFDINENIPEALWSSKVISLILKVTPGDLLMSFAILPFCSAQEDHTVNIELFADEFKIYRSLSKDLIVQLGAYGDELSYKLAEEYKDGEAIYRAIDFFRKSCVR